MSDNGGSYRQSEADRSARLDADVSYVRHSFVRWAAICMCAGLIIDAVVVVYIMIVGFSSPEKLLLLLAGTVPLAIGLFLFRFAFASIVNGSKEQVTFGREGASITSQSTVDSTRARSLENSVSTNTGALHIVSALDAAD